MTSLRISPFDMEVLFDGARSPTQEKALLECLADYEGPTSAREHYLCINVEWSPAATWQLFPNSIKASGDGWLMAFHGQEAQVFFDPAVSLAPWQLTNPFRQIIGWAFDDLVGGALVHAAAVSTPHGAVLIGGPSGVGKSTLVAHCVPGVGGGDGAEVGFMGDDWVGLYRAGTRYVVSPIYRSLKIARDNPLAKGLAWIEAKHETKALCLVDEFPLPPTALATIVVPTIVPSVGVSVKGISPMQAVQRIAPSTLLQSGNLSPGVLETICDAAEDTPCYSLEVGTGAALAPWIFAGLAERKWT